MSFGLARGRQLDPAPGRVLISSEELGPLPDEILTDPTAGWQDPRAWFSVPDRPLHIEVGPGKGAFLVDQAGLEPEVNFLGIEWAHEFAVYAADRIRRRQDPGVDRGSGSGDGSGDGSGRGPGTHANIRLLCHDATELLRWRVPTGAVAVIHLYFSDPWPKRRHWKNRVVQDRFLADCWRVLEPGGELRVVTDHDELWAWDEEHFDRWTASGAWDLLDRLLPAPARPGAHDRAAPGPFTRHSFARPEGVREGETIGTNYERKFRPQKEAAGGGIHAATLRREPRPVSPISDGVSGA